MMAGTYVRYAGEKHPGGAPAVPPTFKVRALRGAACGAPASPRGPRDKLPTRTPPLLSTLPPPLALSPTSPSVTLSFLSSCGLARDPRRESNAPAGTRRHHANLRGRTREHRRAPARAPLPALRAPPGNRSPTWPSVAWSFALFLRNRTRLSRASHPGKRGKDLFAHLINRVATRYSR